MSDLIVVTGITGFLGSHLARTALEAGYRVRGSLRDLARADRIRAALADAGTPVDRLEFVALDLTRDAGWADAMADARYLLHAASPFVTTMPRDRDDLIRPAVEGTERAIGAALAAGVERIVLTSSSVTISHGRGRHGKPHLSAADWIDEHPGPKTAYAESKTRAERRAWDLVAQEPTRLAAVNPGFITGPTLDDDPGTSGATILRFLRGNFPVAPDLSLHVVDVRDAAAVHVAALTDPAAAGQRIPTSFESVDIYGIGRILAAAHPAYARRMPRWRAPDWLIRAYALLDGDVRANVSELGYRPTLDATLARQLLGRTPISAAASITDMADGLLARGLV
ncbi:NAD-dependent epimerase/dehydratase family protein [Granulicoccus phenolivorans]|uniref:NAD-dependent epimerase/dehydratase family protein n=1 Tax=Granulicoccus phenolivorans TaxID=266854 RepID=UPI00041A7AE4|nr:NAD-dependent epimerase/dehydratase family protein [Granulicoccus phenolivorans]